MKQSTDYTYSANLLMKIVQEFQNHEGPFTLEDYARYEADMRIVKKCFGRILKKKNLSLQDCTPLGLPQYWPVGIVKTLAAYAGDGETAEFWKSYIQDDKQAKYKAQPLAL